MGNRIRRFTAVTMTAVMLGLAAVSPVAGSDIETDLQPQTREIYDSEPVFGGETVNPAEDTGTKKPADYMSLEPAGEADVDAADLWEDDTDGAGNEIADIPFGGTIQEGACSAPEPVQTAQEDVLGTAGDGYDAAQVMDYIYQMMYARSAKIDLSSFGIPGKDIAGLVNSTINAHPDLFAVRSRRYSSDAEGRVVYLLVKYDDALDSEAFDRAVYQALSIVSEGMSDTDRVVAIHDYLVANCEYAEEFYESGEERGYIGEDPMVTYSAYGALVNHSAVCNGYGLAFLYLMQKLGIDAYYVANDYHGWNLVKLGNNYYHVDCTWDDPVAAVGEGTYNERSGSGVWGQVNHAYLLVSDEMLEYPTDISESGIQMAPHEAPWEVFDVTRFIYGSASFIVDRSKKELKAEDRSYESGWFRHLLSPMVYREGKWYFCNSRQDGYYLKAADAIYSLNDDTLDKTLEEVSTGDSPLWESIYNLKGVGIYGQDNSNYHTGFPSGSYTGLFLAKDRFFFNDYSRVYSLGADGSDLKTEAEAPAGRDIVCCFSDGENIGYSYDESAKKDRLAYFEPESTDTSFVGMRFANPVQELPLGSESSAKLYVYSQEAEPSDCTVRVADGCEDIIEITGRSDDGSLVYFRAKAAGMARITAQYGEYETECRISVVAEGQWYEDYDYEVDKENRQLILKKYNGADTTVTVPADAVISGIDYEVVLRGGYEKGFSKSAVKSVVLQDGLIVRNPAYLFEECSSLTTVQAGKIDFEGAADFSRMFNDCPLLTGVDLSMCDMSGAKSLYAMFNKCKALENVKLGWGDFSKVSNAGLMFQGCESLLELDLSGVDLSGASDLSNMFYGCESLLELDLSGFDLSALKGESTRKTQNMLAGCSALERLVLPGKLDTEGNIQLDKALYLEGNRKVGYRNISKAPVGAVLVKGYPDDYWYEEDSVAKVIILESYLGKERDVFIPADISIDGERWEIVLGLDNYAVFAKNTYIVNVEMEEGIKINSAYSMFWNCTELETVSVPEADTAELISTYGMFAGCGRLRSVDISGMDLAGIESSSDIAFMFYECTGLEEIWTPTNAAAEISIPVTLFDSAGTAYTKLPGGRSDSLYIATKEKVSENSSGKKSSSSSKDSGSSAWSGSSSGKDTGSSESSSGSSSGKEESGSEPGSGSSSGKDTGSSESSSGSGSGKEESGSESGSGSSSGKDTGSSESSSGSSSGKEESGSEPGSGSSSDKDGSGSGQKKDDSSSGGDSLGNKTAVQIAAEEARVSGRGSVDPSEVRIKSIGGTKPVYAFDPDDTGIPPVGEDGVLTITMEKGDKIQLFGFDRLSAALIGDPTRCVKVNAKGLLTAKKPTPGVNISYMMGGRRIQLRIVVIQPAMQSVGEVAAAVKNLKAEVMTGNSFDLVLNVPLNARIDIGKMRIAGIEPDDVGNVFTVNSEGRLHVSGKAIIRGKSKIPFTVYGKKYNLQIIVK